MHTVAINDQFIDFNYLVTCSSVTTNGKFNGRVKAEDGKIFINGKAITFQSQILPKSNGVMLVWSILCSILWYIYHLEEGWDPKRSSSLPLLLIPSRHICDVCEPWEKWQFTQDCQQCFLHHKLLRPQGYLWQLWYCGRTHGHSPCHHCQVLWDFARANISQSWGLRTSSEQKTTFICCSFIT